MNTFSTLKDIVQKAIDDANAQGRKLADGGLVLCRPMNTLIGEADPTMALVANAGPKWIIPLRRRKIKMIALNKKRHPNRSYNLKVLKKLST